MSIIREMPVKLILSVVPGVVSDVQQSGFSSLVGAISKQFHRLVERVRSNF